MKPTTVLLFLACAVAGCHDKDTAGKASAGALQVGQGISRHSGYAGSADDWKRFLGCWNQQAPHGADSPPSALRGRLRTDGADTTHVLAEMDAAEQRLGVKLPKSYRDFVLAFAALPKPDTASIEQYTGILPPSQIGFVCDLSPMSAQVAAENPGDSPDRDYLVYGAGQDDAAMRSSYVPGAILIGKYGDASFEEIVLYPQLATRDGELEAALGYHSGQFRAPSFAELMRQLGHLELRTIDSSPPFRQETLRGTCADLLPMREVWWP